MAAIVALTGARPRALSTAIRGLQSQENTP